MSEKYDCGAKRQFRRDVWAFIDRSLQSPKKTRRVLVIESSLGGEVEELLRRGYNSSLVHVVNKSPAIVATVQRKFRDDPRMRGPFQTHGLDLKDLAGRYDGELFDAISLDFTSCLYDGLIQLISRVSTLLKDGGVIVVTVQRGRETGETGQLLMSRGDGDPHRADALRVKVITYAISMGSRPPDQNGCQWHATDSRWGAYKGDRSGVSMLWVGMKVVGHSTGEHIGVFSTLDPFLPSCVNDAMERRGLKPSKELYVACLSRNGQGARKFWYGSPDFKTATKEVERVFGAPTKYCDYERPQQLDVWAEKRGRPRA